MFKKIQIENLYKTLLLRDVDESGLNSYVKSDLSIVEIESVIKRSDEYKSLLLKQSNYSDPLLDSPRNLPRNTTVKFFDTDTESLYEENIKRYGDSWIWSNVDISYKLNSLGYRMKEFNEIDWTNYMAVFGCSFTTGVGLPIGYTFSHKISESLNLDLVNAGVPGGSNDLILMNLTRLLSTKKLPKLIILNWSHLRRKSYWSNGRPIIHGATVDSRGDKWNKSFANYLDNYNDWPYEFINILKQANTLCSLANVPVWHITNFDCFGFVDEIETFRHSLDSHDLNYLNSDIGRDFDISRNNHAHPGLKLQNKIVDRFNEIKTNFGF